MTLFFTSKLFCYGLYDVQYASTLIKCFPANMFYKLLMED